MRFRTEAILSVFILLAVSVGAQQVRQRPAEWAQPMLGSELENFHRVDDKLYRSEQPGDDEMVEIEQFGIRHVLSLREYHSDEDEAEDTNLILHQVETDADDITAAQIEQALRIIIEADGPILVHCWHGSDRTGAVVAAYRMVVQEWTFAAAWDEMINGDYGFHTMYEDHMRGVLFNLDVEGMRGRLNEED